MPFALSNLIPISDEFHWQYEQHRMKGPAGWPLLALSGAASRFGSAVLSRETVVRWPTQMGHWKQLRVHLYRAGCQYHASQSVCQEECERLVRYLLPSLLMLLLGTSNRQAGQ